MVTLTVPSHGKPKDPVRFFGTYPAKVATGTNQVTLPKAFKKIVEESDEGHLMLVPPPLNETPFWRLYTRQVFNQILENTKTSNPSHGKSIAQKLARSAVPVEPDSQGRFVISRDFTKKLRGESNDVLFVSAHTHLQLWTQEEFDADQAKQAEESEEFKKSMREALDI
ncbi:MAG TPA: division/cell wall cluster transcriptional repressor MraZ [Planctomycetota bacterium]|nr:division/cell wall cluster transcriptional repressor MraZ [Planctomycetota bacterium]